MNSLASTWQPSSKGRRVAASMASMAASGAIRLRCFLRTVSRAAAKIGAFCSRRAQFLIAFASFGSRLARDLAGEGHGAFQQIAFNQLVHDAGLERVLRLDRISARTHLNRFGDAGQPRQALRARCSWNEAELHFRLSDLRAGRSHAVVAGHGHLQAAAKGGAVDRHHHRLGAVFNLQQQREQSRTRSSLALGHLGEFFDVRAGDKSAAAADDHGRDHSRVLLDLINGFGNSFGTPGLNGVHRRIVDGDDRNTVSFYKLHERRFRQIVHFGKFAPGKQLWII